MRTTIAFAGIIASAALAASGATAATSGSFEGSVKDAWLTGRIETMYLLNEHLSPFSITTDVDDGVVHLTGTVESEIDRDLAAALAKNVDGVRKVENALIVDADAPQRQASGSGRSGRRDFGTWVDDATTTAAVKTRLIRNSSTKGLQIDVDTADDVVTLSGSVASEEEKELAEEIARGASDVTDVRNNLVVDPS